MVGVYWHQVCSYGQPVGSKELLETAVASDSRLTNVLFFRSVEGTKVARKTSAEGYRTATRKMLTYLPTGF